MVQMTLPIMMKVTMTNSYCHTQHRLEDVVDQVVKPLLANAQTVKKNQMVIDTFATLPTAEKPSQRKTTLRRTSESTWELDPFIAPILAVVLTLPGLEN